MSKSQICQHHKSRKKCPFDHVDRTQSEILLFLVDTKINHQYLSLKNMKEIIMKCQ